MSKMLKMHPNLMCPATVQPAFKQTRLAPTAHYFEIRLRFPSAFARNRHFFAVNAVTRDRGHNCSGTATQLPGYKGEVNFFHGARRELPREIEMRKIILCHYQAAACFLIKPMNNARSLLAADAGEIFAMRKQGINQCAAFPSSARMNGNSRRFVYNNQVVVFEENGERDLFWHEVDRFKGWFHQDNAIARPNDVARTRHSAIDRDETIVNQRLDSRTRKLVRRIGEKTIQAGAGVRIRCCGNKLATVFLCH